MLLSRQALFAARVSSSSAAKQWIEQPARRFAASSSSSVSKDDYSQPPSVTLYQYQICPFCNKAKTFLDYVGLDYEAVEVNPLTKAELKPWSGDYRKVPIALIDDRQVNGSDEIVVALCDDPRVATLLESSKLKDMTLDDFTSSTSAVQWSSFARDELATLLYPNICRTLGDSYKAFGYVNSVPSFSTLNKLSIRGLGSVAMYLAASKIKSKKGITDERQALHDALTQLEQDGLSQGTPFVSGRDEPNMGDLSLFGTLRSVKGLPAHAEAIEQRGGKVLEWYDRMKKHIYSTDTI